MASVVSSGFLFAGKLRDNLGVTLAKVKSTLCNCGALSLPEFYQKARLTLASAVSIHEGGAHDVILKDARVTPTEV